MKKENLKNEILRNAGGSYKDGVKITAEAGYCVSIEDGAIIPVEDFTEEDAERHIEEAKKKKALAGFWIDGGRVFCDFSKIFNDYAEGILQGVKNKQLAIFDIKAGASVDLEPFYRAENDAEAYIDAETEYNAEDNLENKRYFRTSKNNILKNMYNFSKKEREIYLKGLQFYGLTAGKDKRGERFVEYIDLKEDF